MISSEVLYQLLYDIFPETWHILRCLSKKKTILKYTAQEAEQRMTLKDEDVIPWPVEHSFKKISVWSERFEEQSSSIISTVQGYDLCNVVSGVYHSGEAMLDESGAGRELNFQWSTWKGECSFVWSGREGGRYSFQFFWFLLVPIFRAKKNTWRRVSLDYCRVLGIMRLFQSEKDTEIKATIRNREERNSCKIQEEEGQWDSGWLCNCFCAKVLFQWIWKERNGLNRQKNIPRKGGVKDAFGTITRGCSKSLSRRRRRKRRITAHVKLLWKTVEAVMPLTNWDLC